MENKIFCNKCNKYLSLDRFKLLSFGREYDIIDIDGEPAEIDYEVAHIECSSCGNYMIISDSDKVMYYRRLEYNKSIKNSDDFIYFEQIPEKDEFTSEQINQLTGYRFKCFDEQYADDDTNSYYRNLDIININGAKVGKIEIYYNGGEWYDIVNDEHKKIDDGSYDIKILFNNESNDKTLEELETYQRVMEPLGYDEYPFEDCEYTDYSFVESLNRYKEALGKLSDILNVKYINNIDILLAEQSGKLLDRHSYVITNIFCNTKYYNFKPESINDCKFRILPDIINVHCEAESEEEFDFSTPITTKLMQVWRNNKIIGYIVLSQQYPLELDFRMNVINRASPDGYKTLCDYYSRIYKI